MKKVLVQLIGFIIFVPIMLALSLARVFFKFLYETFRDSAEWIADISLKMRSWAYKEEDKAAIKEAIRESIKRRNS